MFDSQALTRVSFPYSFTTGWDSRSRTWVGLTDLDIPLILPSYFDILPNEPNEPKQNMAASGIAKIKINPTQPRSETYWLTLY